jgi:hypothetical protein
MPTPEPVRLSDDQLNAVLAAATPLQPHRRSAFLEEVAREISRHPILGDGLLHRLIVTIQRRHFDPPEFGSDAGASRSRRRIIINDDEDDRPHRKPQPRTLGALT